MFAALGTWIVYGRTLQYGFHYDDYHFIRPYALEDVRAAFRGPWDSSGIELPFYLVDCGLMITDC